MNAAVEEGLACPICAAPAPRLLYRLSRFSIYACRACTQVYLHPLPSEAEIREMFATLYTRGETALPELRGYYDHCYDDSPDNPLVRRYEIWLDAIERHRPPGRILDVGCGTGLFLAVARRRGWQPRGIDESLEATRHAREHFGIDVWTGEFAELPAGAGGFDAITGWDVIEHSRDPVGLLRVMRAHLAPGGVVALSTPNQRSILDLVAGGIYRASGGRLRRALEKFYIDQHFLYFTAATLTAALARAGLRPVQIERELTDLSRLELSLAKRALLESLFALSRVLGRENRLFSVSRPSRGA